MLVAFTVKLKHDPLFGLIVVTAIATGNITSSIDVGVCCGLQFPELVKTPSPAVPVQVNVAAFKLLKKKKKKKKNVAK